MMVHRDGYAVGVAGLLTIAASGPAFAHHAMGGAMPNTLMQGLLSGLAHPVIGLDHLAFILGVGLLAALIGRPLQVPLAFVAGTLGGAALHSAGMDFPLVESCIALSVIAAGAAVFLRKTGSFTLLGVLLALAGVMHGYAYAESIIGAEPTPLYAYLAGFSLVQYAIAAGVGLVMVRFVRREIAEGVAGLRIAGIAIVVVGLLPLSGAM